MQEGPLAKAGYRLTLPAGRHHGPLPLGALWHAGHTPPRPAHPAGLLADDAHATVPVSLQCTTQPSPICPSSVVNIVCRYASTFDVTGAYMQNHDMASMYAP